MVVLAVASVLGQSLESMTVEQEQRQRLVQEVVGPEAQQPASVQVRPKNLKAYIDPLANRDHQKKVVDQASW